MKYATWSRSGLGALTLTLTLLLGCAATGGSSDAPPARATGEGESEVPDDAWRDDWSEESTRDPFERYNRWVFAFNETADRYVIRPAAVAYRDTVPDGLRRPLSNFTSNLNEPFSAGNHYLQGQVSSGTRSVLRFLINSTIGVLGFFDVAAAAGLERERSDLGLTLGRWGAPEGGYLVLPFLGPSTLRDTTGRGVSYLTRDYHSVYSWLDVDHTERYLMTAFSGLDQRVSLLSLDELIEDSGTDPYIFVRESYLQNRRQRLGEDEWGGWDDDWDDGWDSSGSE